MVSKRTSYILLLPHEQRIMTLPSIDIEIELQGSQLTFPTCLELLRTKTRVPEASHLIVLVLETRPVVEN